jgi:glycerol-3-phosphate dehydrogenase
LREESFSWRTRDKLLQALDEEYDLVIIGGGIVGCGISWEAARRGYSVLLLEKGDIGSGTSSRSSRLIHGGLRYLKHGRLRLVREAARERERLRSTFPYLVRPLPFLIPIYAGEGEGLLTTLFGLWLYDRLAGIRGPLRHRRLRPQDILSEEPRLRQEGLVGGAIYHDCSTDDFRLVLLNAKLAHRVGAHIVSYAVVESLIREHGRVAGVCFQDLLGGETYEARGRVIVNAAGPWGDGVRLMLPSGRRRLRPTKGIHILVPRGRVGNRNAVVMRSPRDGRIVFALPWHRFTLVGTTDTDYSGDPDEVRPEADDVEYLLEALNRAFPEARLTREDVVSSFAALRPLQRRHGVPESEVTRDYRIVQEAEGLISIIGGKLTTYRPMARKAVSRVVRHLSPPASATSKQHTEASMTEAELEELRLRALEESKALGLDVDVVDHLVFTYGPEWARLREYLSIESLRERIMEGLPYLMAEVAYGVDHEMALRLEDVLIRRTKVAYEDPAHGLGVAERVASLMAHRMDWDRQRVQEEVDRYKAWVSRMEAFRREG